MLGIRRFKRKIAKRRREREVLRLAGSYVPRFPEPCDHARLIAEAAEISGLSRADVLARFESYRRLHEKHGYQQRFGEIKTLCFEEAFIVFLFLSIGRPATIVEIGTQHGKSTRRILDMTAELGIDAKVICFDLEDNVQHFTPREATLRLHDVTRDFRKDVLEALHPGLIYLDAHPYGLLKSVIEACLAGDAKTVVAVHDCGRGLCNPEMKQDKADPNISSKTGLWERWVLAEAFGIADPLGPGLDNAESATHRLRIFDTRHGLALIAPRIQAEGGIATSAR